MFTFPLRGRTADGQHVTIDRPALLLSASFNPRTGSFDIRFLENGKIKVGYCFAD
jgi:hypothetical protein